MTLFKLSIDLCVLRAYNIIKERGVITTKRKDLIKLLERNGWYYKRSGGNHDIYTNGTEIEPVSRQTEIKERVAQAIIKRRGLK